MTNDLPAAAWVPRHLIKAQVNAMLHLMDGAAPGLRIQLTEDALGTLTARRDIAVRMVPDKDVGSSGCSVAGGYLTDQVPPVLAIAESASHGRRAFTALHEFGHHLQQDNYALMDLLGEQADDGFALEDAACDAFAAAILLPDEIVKRHVGVRGPSAEAILSLWQSSPQVSRAAVCVRASQLLLSPGHVALLDGDGVVAFSSSRELPPLRRGSDQSGVSIIAASLRSPGHVQENIAQFLYRDGILGQELYAQAVDLEGMTVLVAVTDRAPWLKLTMPRMDQGPRAASRICEQPGCGHEFDTFERPCERCGVPVCPECKRCNCTACLGERTCPSCYLIKPAHLFDAPDGPCQDCA